MAKSFSLAEPRYSKACYGASSLWHSLVMAEPYSDTISTFIQSFLYSVFSSLFYSYRLIIVFLNEFIQRFSDLFFCITTCHGVFATGLQLAYHRLQQLVLPRGGRNWPGFLFSLPTLTLHVRTSLLPVAGFLMIYTTIVMYS